MQNLPEFSPCNQRLMWPSEEGRTAEVNDYLTQNGYSLRESHGRVQKSFHLGGLWTHWMLEEVAFEVSLLKVPVHVEVFSCLGDRTSGTYQGFQVLLRT